MIREEAFDIPGDLIGPHWLSAMAAMVTALIGLVVMAGWILGIEALKTVIPGLVAMQFNTAVCFTLVGIALWLQQHSPNGAAACQAVRLLALTVLSIGAATFAEYLTGKDFGIDQLLFRESAVAENMLYPGRMSPHAAIDFMLAGFALLALDLRIWRQYPAQWAAAGILFVALLALIGQSYRIVPFYGISPFTGMALHTALTFLLLGIGILFARPQQGLAALLLAPGSAGAMTRRLLPAAILIPVLLSWLAMQFSRQYGAANGELGFAIVITLTIMFLTASIWRIGHLLYALDIERHRAIDVLRQANAELDHKVAARTAELADARDTAELGRQWLHTSLMSIGDAVIVTAADGSITLMNPVGERLTAWSSAEAFGQPADRVLRLLDERSGQPLEHPVNMLLTSGIEPQRNHQALLLARDGSEYPVEHSVAPIRDRNDRVSGVILVVRDISARRRTQARLDGLVEALSAERALLDTLLRTAPVGIGFFDRELRFQLVNDRLAEINGLSPDEHLGKSITELLPSLAQQAELVLQQVIETGEPVVNREFSGETHSDPHSLRYWLESWYPVRRPDGSIMGAGAIVEEITQRKRDELALKESEARFRNMADHAPVMIWMTAADGTFTFCNKQCYDFIGTNPEELSEHDWFDYLHHEDRSVARTALATATRQRKPFGFECRLQRHDGVYRWVLGAAVPRMDADGTYLGHIGSLMDISERKQLEQALKDADIRKDHFLAILAHELRNPLAPLQNAVEVLRLSTDLEPRAARVLEILEYQTQQLHRLVDDLLDISCITQGKLEFRKAPVDLRTVIERTVEVSQPLIDEKHQCLTVRVPDEPTMINADAMRLVQAFGNILTNASKYSPRGGQISLAVEREGPYAQVHIKDNGVGIPPDLLPRIFQLFVQLDPTAEQSRPGLGIGLALAKQLIDNHDGSIEVSSQGTNQGSEFLIRLKLVEP